MTQNLPGAERSNPKRLCETDSTLAVFKKATAKNKKRRKDGTLKPLHSITISNTKINEKSNTDRLAADCAYPGAAG
jgi:hypothetical protein